MNIQQTILKVLEEETYNDVNDAGEKVMVTDYDLTRLSSKITEELENITSSSRNNQPIDDAFYWVQCFSENEYEVARCRLNVRGEYWFKFTSGGIKEVKNVSDWKREPILMPKSTDCEPLYHGLMAEIGYINCPKCATQLVTG